MTIFMQKKDDDAKLPTLATPGSLCYDLYASSFLFTEHEKRFGRTVSFGRPQKFSVGWAFGIPPGWGMLLFSRSGHGFNYNVRLSNCVGVIDSDYRDRVMVSLCCDDQETLFVVRPGDRIAQFILMPRPEMDLCETTELMATTRAGGFGSTGA